MKMNARSSTTMTRGKLIMTVVTAVLFVLIVALEGKINFAWNSFHSSRIVSNLPTRVMSYSDAKAAVGDIQTLVINGYQNDIESIRLVNELFEVEGLYFLRDRDLPGTLSFVVVPNFHLNACTYLVFPLVDSSSLSLEELSLEYPRYSRVVFSLQDGWLRTEKVESKVPVPSNVLWLDDAPSRIVSLDIITSSFYFDRPTGKHWLTLVEGGIVDAQELDNYTGFTISEDGSFVFLYFAGTLGNAPIFHVLSAEILNSESPVSIVDNYPLETNWLLSIAGGRAFAIRK
jgi:hypothetical protein